MKFVIDLTSLADNFTGIERFTANITYQMVKQSEKDEFVLLFKEKVFPIFQEFTHRSNVQFYVLHRRKKLLFSQLILPIELYKHPADWYLFMAFPAPLFFFSHHSVSAIHDIGCWDCPDAMKKISRAYFQILYRKAALFQKRILTVSEFSKHRIMEKLHVADKNLLVINNGISDNFEKEYNDKNLLKDIKHKYNLPDGYILCLSTLEPRKNMRLLVEAFQELTLLGKIDCYLVLAGRKGWKIENLLSGLKPYITKKIIVTGFIEDEDLPCIYQMADLFVFPSIYEGFGIPPLEAMSVGTFVLSSDATSLPEVLDDAAMYFKSNDRKDLEDKIIACLAVDEKQRQEFVEKGKENCKRFSWSKEAKKLLRDLGDIDSKTNTARREKGS